MQAIVLSRRDFREYDQIISLYTKEEGKREVLARGVKKTVSKNSAFLEPFSFVEVEIVRGKEIDHLTTVQPIDLFKKIRSDLRKALYASYVVKLIDRIIISAVPDKRIFELVISWLAFVNTAGDVSYYVVSSCMVKLIGLLGFVPQLDRCLNCNEPLVPARAYTFDIKNGGVVCPTCAPRVSEQIPKIVISEEAHQAFKTLLSGQWAEVNALHLPKEAEEKLHSALYSFVRYHSERPVEDWRIIDTL
ncbi:MAG TPA: DNA repair protein RecO [Patescibacteria group bacterium]|nr:DNA repair protein RecO [Patescibacteria group bacterium]